MEENMQPEATVFVVDDDPAVRAVEEASGSESRRRKVGRIFERGTHDADGAEAENLAVP